jgi:CDP-archaeol synthase
VALKSAQILYLLSPLLLGVLLFGIVLRIDLWPGLARPIDVGATYRGRRLFGPNKTWRALVCSLMGCVAGVAIQRVIGDRAGSLALVDYDGATVLWLGVTLSLGATAAELLNSFMKRQLDIPAGGRLPGKRAVLFYVLDQIDALIILWPLLLLWCSPGWVTVVLSFAWFFVLHQAVSLIGQALHLRATRT